ncbi:MAG: YkgJ family cysteine cluster protein [Terracidiphilus sp.]
MGTSRFPRAEYRKIAVKGNRSEKAARRGILAIMQVPGRDSELVQIVDAALADAARRAGEWLVCRLGCTQCCYGAFAISPLDALRLQAGIRAVRGAEPDLGAEIVRRAQDWIAEHGAGFPGDAQTGLLGDSQQERERFEEFADEAACPALDPATGRCDLYAWRPMTCRVFGPPVRMEAGMGGGMALGHCELCFAGASEAEVARCEMPVPHELEAGLLDEIGGKGETVVAFALLR